MKIKQIASLLLCVISLCLPLSAKDIFVSLSTGKNSNPGTKAAPYKNLWKAINVAKDNDVIHIAEGIPKCGIPAYLENSTLLGSTKINLTSSG